MLLGNLVDNWDNYMTLLKNLILIIIILFTVYYIFFSILLVFLFKKENINWHYAIIPFYNLYHYFIICKLPWWPIVVPFVNVIVFICSPYCLLKEYQCEKWKCALAIAFPYVMVPIIVFNDNYKNKRFKVGYAPFRTVFDVEKIEHNLENNNEMNYIDYENFENNSSYQKRTNEYTSNVDILIGNIENDAIVDEYFDFNLDYSNNPINLENEQADDFDIKAQQIDQEEMFEIFDKINDEDGKFTSDDVKKLEEKIEQDIKIEVADSSNYAEYREKEISSETIAFGGEQKIEDKTHSKVEELKCPRCGSSLIGAINNICPGCGSSI